MTWFGRQRDPQERRGFELIGVELKRRRVALGWTQRILEAQSGIDQTVISRLENGKQYGMRWSRFALLVEALDGIGAIGRPSAKTDRDRPRPGRSTPTDAASIRVQPRRLEYAAHWHRRTEVPADG